MSFLSKIPIPSALKKRRIPNAFMLFVKEQKEQLVKKCPEESMTVIGTFLGKKWKSMGLEDKQVYYDKYNALKKRYEDSPVLSSIKAEDPMDNDLLKEISEITKAETEGIKSDQKTSKSSNKRKADESAGGAILHKGPPDNKKYKTRLKSNANGTEIPLDFKDTRKRTRNPFLIFAKEQRSNIKAASKKDHVSTILGNMWQDLDYSEKRKYFEMAKPANKEVIPGALPSEGKTKNKTKRKKESKKSVARSFGIGNDTASSKDTTADKPGKKDGINNAFSESRFADPQLPSTIRQEERRPSWNFGASPNCQQSMYSCLKPSQSHTDMNNSSVIPYSANLGGFYRPYFGGGMSGLYTPDPYACMPYWMYQQTTLPYCYPFASPYQTHCHCSPPYHGYPAGASHFRSVFYGRASAAHPSDAQAAASSSVGGNSSNGEEVVQNTNARNDNNHDDVSDDENRLVIVDNVEMEHPNGSESGPHV